MIYLSSEQLLFLHARLVDETGRQPRYSWSNYAVIHAWNCSTSKVASSGWVFVGAPTEICSELRDWGKCHFSITFQNENCTADNRQVILMLPIDNMFDHICLMYQIRAWFPTRRAIRLLSTPILQRSNLTLAPVHWNISDYINIV